MPAMPKSATLSFAQVSHRISLKDQHAPILEANGPQLLIAFKKLKKLKFLGFHVSE